MFNPARLLGVIGTVVLIATATATSANAADQFPVPDTGITLSAAQVGDCNPDGTRTITYEGTARETSEGATLANIFLGGVEFGSSGVLETFTGAKTFTISGSKLPGMYDASLFYSQRDTTLTVPLEPVTVPSCTSTPVTPTLEVITTGECAFSVLYTGDRPQLDISVKGKKVITTILAEDTEPGVIEVTFDATGANDKGKNAYVYRVTVKADNGLIGTTNARCP